MAWLLQKVRLLLAYFRSPTMESELGLLPAWTYTPDLSVVIET
jgi:hypothetical protein